MKAIIIILFLVASVAAFSQGSRIAFELSGNTPATADKLTDLELPLNISFTKEFRGKELILMSGPQKINEKQILGEADLTFNGDEPFVYQIDVERKTNPGDHNVPAETFDLIVDGKKFSIAIRKTSISRDEQQVIFEEDYIPGYIFYDAIKIADERTPVAIKINLLEAYGLDPTSANKNPYLKDIYDNLKKLIAPQGGIGGIASALGNTDVTYFAAGLARFLAERTKEELNEAFFRKMKERLNSFPELRTIFPKTASFLNVIETYSYASIIQVLKESFETDIKNLPENLYKIKSLTKDDCDAMTICGEDKNDCNSYKTCQARLTKLVEFFGSQEGHWVALAMLAVKEGIQSTNPADLLKLVVESDEFSSLKSISITNKKFDEYNIASAIELGNMVSQSLISKEDDQVWITSKQLRDLFTTKNAFRVYLGLLLSLELKETNNVVITFHKNEADKKTFGEILIKSFDSYETQVAPLIKNAYAAFNASNNAVKKVIEASEKSIAADPQALYDYYRTLTSSLYPIAHSELLKNVADTDIAARYDKVEEFLNPSVDIAYHIATKKYSSAIYDVSILLDALTNFKSASNNNSTAAKGVEASFIPVTRSFLKYGTLISTVASAESSDEVKKALEASVLPVGSYSIKRKTDWSISVNAYVGAYWNYNNSEDYIPSVGLSAPIGVSISKGFKESGKAGGVSVNLQIIDVGALVNYYLLGGDTAEIPNDFKVKFSNIFSPGVSLSYNVPGVPLSVAWGTQYIPTLYSYEQIDGEKELVPNSEWRWQFSILVDIPMFNIKIWDFGR